MLHVSEVGCANLFCLEITTMCMLDSRQSLIYYEQGLHEITSCYHNFAVSSPQQIIVGKFKTRTRPHLVAVLLAKRVEISPDWNSWDLCIFNATTCPCFKAWTSPASYLN